MGGLPSGTGELRTYVCVYVCTIGVCVYGLCACFSFQIHFLKTFIILMTKLFTLTSLAFPLNVRLCASVYKTSAKDERCGTQWGPSCEMEVQDERNILLGRVLQATGSIYKRLTFPSATDPLSSKFQII